MARLPIPGSDDGSWGDILNAYLLQSLTADGSIKTGAVGSPQLADTAVTSAKLAPSAVTSSHLSTGSVTNSAITDGAIAQSKIANLSGDLAGKANTTHTHSIADTTNLQTTLDSKAGSVHTHTASQLSDASTAGRTLITAADATAQRTALGLGSAATLTVGTTAGTVAAGDDSRLTGALQASGLDAATAGLVGDGGSATMSSLTSTIEAPGSPLREAMESRRVAPTLAPITERIDYLRAAVIQVGSDVWAFRTETAGAIPTFQKSTDAGLTWTTLSTMPAVMDKAYRLSSGTFLAIEPSNHAISGGSNPRVWRSADAGATWTLVATGLRMGPLTAQGFCEGSDGSVMICEYGSATTIADSKIFRSTDDGITWTAVLTATNRHFHSVTYDAVAGKHITFADDTSGGVPPQIYASSNNGATWTLVGEVTDVDQPNFVAPMYFPTYIAWGSDNQINGRISRILRTDFYAGNFDRCQQIGILSRRAVYASFPLRPDVWAVSFNGEHIAGDQDEVGSTMCDVWLVSNDGELISGGLESHYVRVQPGALSGVRPAFPAIEYDALDHDGFMWVNMPTGQLYGHAAVPTTQGWGASSHRLDHTGLPVLRERVPLLIQKTDHPTNGVIRFIERLPTYTAVRDDSVSATIRAELQFKDTSGDLELRSGTTALGWLRTTGGVGKLIINKRLDMAQNDVGIRTDSGVSPEGVVTAPLGTIYQSWGGQPCLWYKFNGSGNTGWRPLMPAIGAAADFGSAAHAVNTVGKYEGREGWDSTGKRPVWASGATAGAPWYYADGTTAYTPA